MIGKWFISMCMLSLIHNKKETLTSTQLYFSFCKKENERNKITNKAIKQYRNHINFLRELNHKQIAKI